MGDSSWIAKTWLRGIIKLLGLIDMRLGQIDMRANKNDYKTILVFNFDLVVSILNDLTTQING